MARGFLAEMNHQAKMAEKRRRQQHNEKVRAHNAAVRQQERALQAAKRAQAAALRASAAERKAAEKEAARLHAEARNAEVEAMNADLAAELAEIDGMLAWTLEVDDYVDLESLKVVAEHPEFDAGKLGSPEPPVAPLSLTPQPVFHAPPTPRLLFGGKKRHAAAIASAEAEHQKELRRWEFEKERKQATHAEAVAAREGREVARRVKLEAATAAYRAECEKREEAVAQRNSEVDKLINDLAFDVEQAIETYIGIVLANSVYPDNFQVDYEHSFDVSARELALSAFVPEPSVIPTVKAYRYMKSKDEITSAALPIKSQKDRYAAAVHQVAVRTLHEVFEADRAGKIHSISLKVDARRIAPATGLPEDVPLVVVAADRTTFSAFDLSNVVPSATLQHLGASMSKSPFDLTPADTGPGVRRRG